MSRLSYRVVAAAFLSCLSLVGLYYYFCRNTDEFSTAAGIPRPSDISPQQAFVDTPDNLEFHPESAPEHVLEPEENRIVEDGTANAVLLMLARNREVEGAVSSVRQLEERFNHRFQYPWVFLNEEPFTEEFKSNVSAVTSASVSFGLIPHDDWFQPDWIDEERAKKGREDLVRQDVIYGGSVSYRNMCRFQSQQFFKHELVLPYRWYWRVEPDVTFTCEVDFDPFVYLQNNNKIYGFTISLHEFNSTIPSLWPTVKQFIQKNPQYLAADNAMGFLSDNEGQDYNLCHFWSNFEIADMNFWRGEAYTEFTKLLESTGGYYYEAS